MKHTFQFAWTQTTRKVFSDILYERQRRRWSAIHRASTLSWLPLLSSISSAEPIYVMVVAVFNAIIITVTKQLRNWFGNVQHFEFVNDTRMASFLCRREKGGDCIQDLSLSVVKILLFNKSPITTPFVNKCQKWFSWLTKAWGWWGRWWVAGKVKLVTTGSTCLEAKLSYISLSEAFSRYLLYIITKSVFAIWTLLSTMAGLSDAEVAII